MTTTEKKAIVDNIEDECDQLRRELIGLLDGKLSIMKHKDAMAG